MGLEILIGNSLAYDRIRLEGDTEVAHLVQLILNDTIGQAELWDPVAQDAPELALGLVDGHIIAPLSHIGSEG